MAIEYNNASSGSSSGADGTLTFEHTVNAGSNRILIVGVSMEGTNSPTPIPTVSSITFDGTGLTQIDTQLYSSDYDRVDLWYLLAPAEKTANVVVTLSAGLTAASGLLGGAITINGAKQQAPEVSAKATGTGTAVSVSITTITNNAWVIDVVGNKKSTANMTAGEGQTERWEEADDCRGNGSTKPVVSAGETSMSWTIANSQAWGIIAASFEVAEAGADVTVTPDAITLAGTLQSPSISGDANISPSVLALAGTLQTPSISGDAIISPSALSLTGTLNAPSILFDYVVAVSTLTLSATLQAPTIVTVTDVTVTPDTLTITLTLNDPAKVGMKDGDYWEMCKKDTPGSYTELSKPSDTHTELEKPTDTHTELSKPTTVHTELTKPTTTHKEK